MVGRHQGLLGLDHQEERHECIDIKGILADAFILTMFTTIRRNQPRGATAQLVSSGFGTRCPPLAQRHLVSSARRSPRLELATSWIPVNPL